MIWHRDRYKNGRKREEREEGLKVKITNNLNSNHDDDACLNYKVNDVRLIHIKLNRVKTTTRMNVCGDNKIIKIDDDE